MKLTLNRNIKVDCVTALNVVYLSFRLSLSHSHLTWSLGWCISMRITQMVGARWKDTSTTAFQSSTSLRSNRKTVQTMVKTRIGFIAPTSPPAGTVVYVCTVSFNWQMYCDTGKCVNKHECCVDAVGTVTTATLQDMRNRTLMPCSSGTFSLPN